MYVRVWQHWLSREQAKSKWSSEVTLNPSPSMAMRRQRFSFIHKQYNLSCHRSLISCPQHISSSTPLLPFRNSIYPVCTDQQSLPLQHHLVPVLSMSAWSTIVLNTHLSTVVEYTQWQHSSWYLVSIPYLSTYQDTSTHYLAENHCWHLGGRFWSWMSLLGAWMDNLLEVSILFRICRPRCVSEDV